MRTNRKFSYKYLLTGITSVSLIGWLIVSAHSYGRTRPFRMAEGRMDTVPAKVTVPDTLIRRTGKDSIPKDSTQRNDTTKRDSTQQSDTTKLPMAKDSLDAPIDYAAEDSMVLDIPNKKVYLYDQATTKYKDMNLKAGIIRMDQTTQTLTALPSPGLDSAGLLIQKPEFTQ